MSNQLKVWQGLLLVILVVPLIPALLFWILCRVLVQAFVLLAVWVVWLPRGKDTLIVYSRSPNWMEYFEAGLIPHLERRAMILNWSDRAKWRTLDLRVLVFRAFGGRTSFNPMVILFRPFRWPEEFRFFESFRDLKHGKEQPLRDLEGRLARRLGVPSALNISRD
jgi:hypothetical protein